MTLLLLYVAVQFSYNHFATQSEEDEPDDLGLFFHYSSRYMLSAFNLSGALFLLILRWVLVLIVEKIRFSGELRRKYLSVFMGIQVKAKTRVVRLT